MPCGIPDQQWPYTNIDANNGLRYDTSTGKLWAHPPSIIDNKRAEGSFNLTPTAVAAFGSGVRIAWSYLYEAAGFSPVTEVQIGITPELTVTNTTVRNIFVRPKLHFPDTSHMIGWSCTRSAVKGYLQRDSGAGWVNVASQTVSPHPFRFTQQGYGSGQPFSNNLVLTGESFADSINTENGLNPLPADGANASGTGGAERTHVHGFLIDGGGSNVGMQVPVGATHKFRGVLYGRTPDTAIFKIAGDTLPDWDYLWSHSTVNRPMVIEIETFTLQAL